jgi:hypothetical protein
MGPFMCKGVIGKAICIGGTLWLAKHWFIDGN